MNERAAGGWHDDPITDEHQDKLGRLAVARRFADLIDRNHSSKSSVVYGLEGPWGCGKSSVISLLHHELEGRDGRKWRVLTFTPWATSGTDGLLSEFFATISQAAPNVAEGKRLRQTLAQCMAVARPAIALIPTVGDVLAKGGEALEGKLSKSWKELFEDASAELGKLGVPVLVLVDDIDRLQPSELLDLLKVVRLLGRFPGVDFLLAYDERTIVDTLSSANGSPLSTSRSRMFMEKIVQYPLSIPPLLTSQIVGRLNEGITNVFGERRIEERFDKDRFGEVLLSSMPSQLATPRAIERFLAQLREEVLIHDVQEIDDTDLVLTVFLRLQFPDVFGQLQAWKPQLSGGDLHPLGLWKRQGEEVDWAPLTAGLDDRHQHDAMAVLRALFPAVSSNHAGRVGSTRFANPDYFDRYLAQGIPDGDIPDAVVSTALAQAAEGQPEMLRDLVLSSEDRLDLIVGKISDRYADLDQLSYHQGAHGPVAVPVLACIMGLLNELPENPRSLWTPQISLRGTAIRLLRLILDTNPAANPDVALHCCQSPGERAHVIATASSRLGNLRPATAQALTATLDREVESLAPVLLDHLRKRDAADHDIGFGYLAGLVAGSTAGAQFLEDIQTGIAKQDFTAGDVAARLVGLAYIVGGNGKPSSASFDGPLFTSLTHLPARHMDREDIDWPDTDWPRRRTFAEKFISPATGASTDD